MRDTLRMYNGLVERCFSECVNGFRSKNLDSKEDKCVTTCAAKFLKHSVRWPRPRSTAFHVLTVSATPPQGRVGQRFGEISMMDAAQAAAQGGGAGPG